MADILDATIGNARDPTPCRILTDFVDGGALGSTNSHHFLCDANRARAHANAQGVDAGIDQICRLCLNYVNSLIEH